jgi:hypothetical protein
VIRILLAEDQDMVRGALAALLGLERDRGAQPGRGRAARRRARLAAERGWL